MRNFLGILGTGIAQPGHGRARQGKGGPGGKEEGGGALRSGGVVGEGERKAGGGARPGPTPRPRLVPKLPSPGPKLGMF